MPDTASSCAPIEVCAFREAGICPEAYAKNTVAYSVVYSVECVAIEGVLYVAATNSAFPEILA